jgi:hypothetical protein
MLAVSALLFTATAALAEEPIVLTEKQLDQVTAGAFTVTSFGTGVLVVNQTGPSSGSATMTCSGSCGVTVTATDVVTSAR